MKRLFTIWTTPRRVMRAILPWLLLACTVGMNIGCAGGSSARGNGETTDEASILPPSLAGRNIPQNTGQNADTTDGASILPPFAERMSEIGRNEIDRYFMQGTLRTLQEDYRGGIRYYLAILRVNPNHAPTLEAIARNWNELEEYDSALVYARRSVLANPADTEARRLLAELWGTAGTFDSAAAEYERVLKGSPNDLQARYTVARTWEQRNPEKAVKHYLYIRNNIAEDFNTLVSLYEIYVRQKNYDAAAEMVEILLEHYPDAPTFYETLCAIRTDAGEYDSAMSVLGRADLYIEQDDLLKDFLQPTLTLTELRMRGFGMPEGIQRFADSLVRLTARRLSGYPRALYNAGMIAMRMGNDTAADRLLAQAFRPGREDSLTAIAWTEAAILYRQRRASGRLLNMLGPSAHRYDAKKEVNYQMAMAYSDLGKKDSARLYLRRALEVDPEYAEAWWELGRTQMEEEQTGEGIASYEQAISADPYNPELLNDYAIALARLGTLLEKGRTLADRALRIEPENEIFLTTRGWIAYLEKDYKAAVEYLQRAVNAGGAPSERLELLGDAQRADGMDEKARETYEQALRVVGKEGEAETRLQQKLNGRE